MGDKVRHRLTDKDTSARLATCSVCGPNTKIYCLSETKNMYVCSVKSNESARVRRSRPDYQPPKRERKRRRNLKKYGINEEALEELLLRQKDVCAVCFGVDANRRLAIDHDHRCCPGAGSCGECVRGLLCSRCNIALGLVDDRVDILRSMIAYLDKFS